jgi:hypothetical protein
MTWPSDIPFDPERPRYYVVHGDLSRNPSDAELLNEDQLYPLGAPLADGRRYPIRTGRYERRIAGRLYAYDYGLPVLMARPRLFVARRNKPLDAYGFDPFFVSTRAKDLLRGMDADAFEFAECETVSRAKVEVEPYWMMTNVRPVDGFDEARSVFTTVAEGRDAGADADRTPFFAELIDIRMGPDLPAGAHAFFFPRFVHKMIFDRALVEAWRAAGLTGWRFSPLQPPAPDERKYIDMVQGGDYWAMGKYRDRS